MEKLSRLGRILFAIAMAGFAVQFLVHAFLAGPAPGPPWSPGRPIWAYVTTAVLLAAAVCIAMGRKRHWVAMLLAALLLLRALIVFGPRLAANIHDPGPWTSGSELLALCGAALLLAGASKPGRLLFAATLVVFGIQHFLYARFIATLVPAWIPGPLVLGLFRGGGIYRCRVLYRHSESGPAVRNFVGTHVLSVGAHRASAQSGGGAA